MDILNQLEQLKGAEVGAYWWLDQKSKINSKRLREKKARNA